jgi:hypothetical protein
VVVVVHSHPHNVNSEVPDAPQITVNNKMAKTSKNSAKVGRRRSNATAKKVATKKLAAKPARAKPKLLAGGNPQIAKADGDAPVEAYIAAMPGWKQGVGRRLDALIVRTVPNVRKELAALRRRRPGSWR